MEREVDPMQGSLSDGLDFLQELYEKGLKYSAINTARSALSSILIVDNVPFGKHELVCRFMKGIFTLRPALPRYSAIWDVNVVLTYLETMSPRKNLSLKDLTFKVATLVALLTAQRAQTVQLFDVGNIVFDGNRVQIPVDRLLKTTSVRRHVEPFCFDKYDRNKRLCIVRYLSEYIDRTSPLRGSETQLFISYRKPHCKVSRNTISRWIRTVMVKSGIDSKVFKAHSTRAASVSKMSKFLPIGKVLKTGGWSNSTSYLKHYKLPVSTEKGSDVILSK